MTTEMVDSIKHYEVTEDNTLRMWKPTLSETFEANRELLVRKVESASKAGVDNMLYSRTSPEDIVMLFPKGSACRIFRPLRGDTGLCTKCFEITCECPYEREYGWATEVDYTPGVSAGFVAGKFFMFQSVDHGYGARVDSLMYSMEVAVHDHFRQEEVS